MRTEDLYRIYFSYPCPRPRGIFLARAKFSFRQAIPAPSRAKQTHRVRSQIMLRKPIYYSWEIPPKVRDMNHYFISRRAYPPRNDMPKPL